MSNDAVLLQRLTIKLAINKRLFQWGRLYISQVANALPSWTPAEMIDEVVDEMAADGLLIKETSPRGKLILVYKATPSK